VYSTIRELSTSRVALLSSTDGKTIMRMIMNGKLWEVVIRWVSTTRYMMEVMSLGLEMGAGSLREKSVLTGRTRITMYGPVI